MSQDTDTKCHGCDIECEYGYFQINATGCYLPTLNGRVITSYWLSRSRRKFIIPTDLRNAPQAIKVAREIATHCNHYRNQSNGK